MTLFGFGFLRSNLSIWMSSESPIVQSGIERLRMQICCWSSVDLQVLGSLIGSKKTFLQQIGAKVYPFRLEQGSKLNPMTLPVDYRRWLADMITAQHAFTL